METLLVAIVLIALGLAAVMSAVAWKLLRDGRDRSAARVAALEDLALTEADEDDSRAVGGDWRLDDGTFDEDEPADVDVSLDEEAAEDDDWDLAIRPGLRHPVQPPAAERLRPARPTARVRAVRRPRPSASVAAAHDDMFAATTEPSRRPRRQGLSAVLTATVVLLVGTGIVYAVRSAPALAGAALRATEPNPISLEPLELLSLRHGSDPTGAFTVTGLVQNPVEGASLTDLVAVVYLFDEEGRYFAGGRADIELSTFRPGEESPFVVVVPNAGLVSRYRVGFRFADGGVVAHVDHRGRLPRGTSGDAVNGADRGGDRKPAAPHRVEG